MKLKQLLYEIFCGLLALLFLFTAVSKLVDFQNFVKQINNQNFDKAYTPFLVYSLPAIEILTAGLLIWPKWRKIGLYLSTFLMLAFTLYVALVTFHFYSRVPCACAGVFEHLTWPQHLVFNLLFSTIAISGIWIRSSIENLKSSGSDA